MDDLNTHLRNSGIGCVFNNMPINHLMYADDTCILAPSATGLQKLINICSKYAEKHTIVFNESKTKCMCFKPRCMKSLQVPRVSLNGITLKWTTVNKYLGVILDSNCKVDCDIRRHVKAIYTRGNMLTHKFRNCTDSVKIRLFKSYCNSIYGGVLWTKYKKPTLKKAKVAYNDMFRSLFNIRRGESISSIFVLNRIDSFDVIMRKAIYSFKQRLFNMSNCIIDTIINSNFFQDISGTLKHWNELLYVS